MANAPINRIQQLQFDLVRNARWNLFDGARIVADLEAHRDLWHAAIVDRPALCMPDERGMAFDLIKLRDIEADVWNADTLFVLASGVDDEALERLAGTWQADEVAWMDAEEVAMRLGAFGRDEDRVLVVWWD